MWTTVEFFWEKGKKRCQSPFFFILFINTTNELQCICSLSSFSMILKQNWPKRENVTPECISAKTRNAKRLLTRHYIRQKYKNGWSRINSSYCVRKLPFFVYIWVFFFLFTFEYPVTLAAEIRLGLTLGLPSSGLKGNALIAKFGNRRAKQVLWYSVVMGSRHLPSGTRLTRFIKNITYHCWRSRYRRVVAGNNRRYITNFTPCGCVRGLCNHSKFYIRRSAISFLVYSK